jgi:hypothetical protein
MKHQMNVPRTLSTTVLSVDAFILLFQVYAIAKKIYDGETHKFYVLNGLSQAELEVHVLEAHDLAIEDSRVCQSSTQLPLIKADYTSSVILWISWNMDVHLCLPKSANLLLLLEPLQLLLDG